MISATREVPDLTVLIPAYDEARRISDSLRTVGQYLAERSYSSEILIVDDGSRDDTSSTAREIAEELSVPVRCVRYEINRGKGYALKVGFQEARGRRILFSDSDLSTPIEEAEKLLERLESGFEIAIGTRKDEEAMIGVHQPRFRELLGKGFTLLVRLLLVDVSDVTCGFKAFEAETGKKLFALSRLRDWSFDAEILYLARKQGRELAEVSVYWEDNPGTRVRIGRDSLMALVGLVRIRLYDLFRRYESELPLGDYEEIWSLKGGEPNR